MSVRQRRFHSSGLRRPFRLAWPWLLLLLAGCVGGAPEADAPDPSKSISPSEAAAASAPVPGQPRTAAPVRLVDQALAYAEVAEAFISVAAPELNLDSPAAWQHPDGSMSLYVTSKSADQLLVLDGDGGAVKSSTGRSGTGAGEFDRPNGLFVIDDLLLVVERDNRRVQVMRLPGLQLLGHFGSEVLRSPYGVWVRRDGDAYEAIVSDSFMDGENYDVVPPMSSLDTRFRRFRFWIQGDSVRHEEIGPFGATDEAGAIRMAESLWGDEVHGRLLIAEEYPPVGSRIRVYNLTGDYSGQDLGADLFRAQAEGIALWQCGDGSGYWIATDQYTDRSLFHVFDRETLAHRGSFAGSKTANTDGVWLHQAATSAFPAGVFYAVHDDEAVAAFDWRAIATALELRRRCDE